MVYVLLALEAGVWRSVYSCLWKPCANRACAILEELLHYREVFTSTKRTVYSCFPTFGCTSFKMNGVHSMHGCCCNLSNSTPILPLPSSPELKPLSLSLTHTQMYILHMARSTPTSRLALSSFAYSSACFGMAPPYKALMAKAFISSAPPRWEHFLICVGGGRACLPSCTVYQLYVQHA